MALKRPGLSSTTNSGDSGYHSSSFDSSFPRHISQEPFLPPSSGQKPRSSPLNAGRRGKLYECMVCSDHFQTFSFDIKTPEERQMATIPNDEDLMLLASLGEAFEGDDVAFYNCVSAALEAWQDWKRNKPPLVCPLPSAATTELNSNKSKNAMRECEAIAPPPSSPLALDPSTKYSKSSRDTEQANVPLRSPQPAARPTQFQDYTNPLNDQLHLAQQTAASNKGKEVAQQRQPLREDELQQLFFEMAIQDDLERQLHYNSSGGAGASNRAPGSSIRVTCVPGTFSFPAEASVTSQASADRDDSLQPQALSSSQSMASKLIWLLFAAEEKESIARSKLHASSHHAVTLDENDQDTKLGHVFDCQSAHACCLECLAGYLRAAVQARRWPVNCPGIGCETQIDVSMVETVLGPEALRWHTLGVEHGLDHMIYCPNPQCSLPLPGEEVSDTAKTDFYCPYCNHHFCVQCFKGGHRGMTCSEVKGTEHEREFIKLVALKKWQRCPKCGVVVEKISGCNNMACSRCSTAFCYACGRSGCGRH